MNFDLVVQKSKSLGNPGLDQKISELRRIADLLCVTFLFT